MIGEQDHRIDCQAPRPPKVSCNHFCADRRSYAVRFWRRAFTWISPSGIAYIGVLYTMHRSETAPHAPALGRVDGLEQDEAGGEVDEREKVPCSFLAA
jgi:hypothetical protein